MKEYLSVIKGIHPGILLERELKARNLSKGRFAISVNEYPQTLVSITKGKRKMNISLALKIEKAMGWEEGFLMLLQVYFDIKEEKRKQDNLQPDLSKLRKIIFWDTKMEKIEWERQKKAVIKRVFERGNESEKEEIVCFYGAETVKNILKQGGK
ncbi:MAG: plasmid maintenance system antidote protein [Bacteroidota bacterium]|nr:plasmid maintenance system antidote protein [Bacteroidota bacterium]